MALSYKLEEIIRKNPYEEQAIGLYPAFLIDPCTLPLKELGASKAEGFGKYNTVTLSNPQTLPYGHYSRLIIAYLTTQIIKRPERPSYIIANSVRDLFQQVTGQNNISGGTSSNLLNALERVIYTTFKVTPTNKSHDIMQKNGLLAETDNLITDEFEIGHINIKNKKIFYTPSSSFKALVTNRKSIIPIDLRVLQLARAKNIILAQDLYMYLVRRSYGIDKSAFISWVTLHRDIFPYLEELTMSRFKRQFVRALNFIVDCHPQSGISLDKKGKGIVIPPNKYLLRERGSCVKLFKNYV